MVLLHVQALLIDMVHHHSLLSSPLPSISTLLEICSPRGTANRHPKGPSIFHTKYRDHHLIQRVVRDLLMVSIKTYQGPRTFIHKSQKPSAGSNASRYQPLISYDCLFLHVSQSRERILGRFPAAPYPIIFHTSIIPSSRST